MGQRIRGTTVDQGNDDGWLPPPPSIDELVEAAPADPVPPPPRAATDPATDDAVTADHATADHVAADPVVADLAADRLAADRAAATGVTPADDRARPTGTDEFAGREELAAAVQKVREELARARTPRERFAAAARLAGSPLTSDDLVAVLDALPEGWQRRTVVRQLVRAGGLDDLDAGRVVGRFGGSGERARVASLLVDAGLAHVATVTDHLGPTAADRIRRRRQ